MLDSNIFSGPIGRPWAVYLPFPRRHRYLVGIIQAGRGFGIRKTDGHRHALSGYTWMRTNRGPQKSWLTHIGKGDEQGCECGHPIQDGDHITFECPRFRKERRELLGPRRTWEALDKPNWRKDEGDDSYWDTIEAFFDLIYSEFS